MSPRPSFPVEPGEIDHQKRERAYRLAVVEMPRVRAVGFALLSLLVYLNNRFLLHQFSLQAWALITGILAVYGAISWVALVTLYRRVRFDLALLFLILDIPIFTLVIYFSGAERSWLFAVLLTRVADQIQTTVRRCVTFAALGAVSYGAMLGWVVWVDSRSIDGGAALFRVAFLLVAGLYIAVTARTGESRRRRLTAAVRTSRDLIRRLEEQSAALRETQQRAEGASAAKSEFLANVSHEMRTPLHGILGMLQLAMDSDPSVERRQQLDMARRSAESLLATIEDILDFTKIEARKLELEPVYFSIRELITDTMKTLGVTALQKGLSIAFSIARDVPDRLWGDPLRLRQILINLVGNAIKFTSNGEVAVRVWCDALFSSDLTLHLEIRDTGIGIDAHKRDAIFDPFAQADSSHSRRYGGTGLGLSIVGRLVQSMGGEVSVESAPNEGSTFRVSLKLAQDAIEGVAVPGWQRGLGGMRILVVDPHDTSREILGESLRAYDMVPELYASIGEALQPSIREAFACVVIDSRVLVSTPWIPPVPVVQIISPISSALHPTVTVTRPVGERELIDAIGVALGLLERRVAFTLERRAEGERPLKVLVVDDHPVNLEFAAEALRRLGHTVLTAGSSEDALELLVTRAFDVAFVDVQMPEMDGFEITRRFRATDHGARTRIIALTAHTSPEDRERCLTAGMDDVMTKPVSQPRLAAILSGRTSDVDADSIMEAVGGNVKLLQRVRDAFAAQSPRLLGSMRDSIEQRDADALYRSAHTLKGAISNFGFGDALDAAVQLERAGKDGDFDSARHLLPRLEDAVRDLEQRMAMALTQPAETEPMQAN
ncbi:MAG TPA: ATP-binding protein [Thermoanaerobaculia bacterium]